MPTSDSRSLDLHRVKKGAGFQGFQISRLSRKLNGLGCLTYLQSSLVCVRGPDQQV